MLTVNGEKTAPVDDEMPLPVTTPTLLQQTALKSWPRITYPSQRATQTTLSTTATPSHCNTAAA